MRVSWELNPQPFALLTQCSTTEPQEHVKCKYCACWQTIFTVTPATNVWLTFKMKKIRIRFNVLSGVSSRASDSNIF